MEKCSICRKNKVIENLNFGQQPVWHRFLRTPQEEYTHPIKMGQCHNCGTVQLIDLISVSELKPRFDWLTCTEPEAHLDQLVETLSNLPGITNDSKICGISFKDDSTLERFNKLGFMHTWRVEPKKELGLNGFQSSVESLQERINLESAVLLTSIHGKSDIVLVRHILEHVYDFQTFLDACKQLVSLGGYIVFEIPDCGNAFSQFDYTTVWEEHTLYFTSETFRNCFTWGGLNLVYFETIEYTTEDSHIGIAQLHENPDESLDELVLNQEIQRIQKFTQEFSNTKKKIKDYLSDYSNRYGKIALFGSGHMGCTFINLFELKDTIDFVVDDNPHMQGMFMPGSQLPILESKAILEQNIQLCLLTLSLTSEEKVMKKNKKYFENGGRFASVFPGSSLALQV